MASGRECDVFALDDDRVLRRSRTGHDVGPEVAIMNRLHALGFPVPEVYSSGGPDIVMQRLNGPTMLHALTTGQVDLEQAARILASLHDELHRTPIIHLDLHPDNVVLTPSGPVAIDWRNAVEGEADLDVAMTAVILAQVAVADDPLAPAAGAFLDAFLRDVSGDPQRLLAEAIARRAADPTMSPTEIELLPRARARVLERIKTGH